MEFNQKTKDEIFTGHLPIKMNIAVQVSKSICKIIINKDEEINYGTGFFMKFSSSLKCLITNYHVINNNLKDEQIELEIYNQKIMKLLVNNRFIKYFEKPKDITIIEINNSDVIYDDIEFLNYDSNYKQNGYLIYKNVNVFTIQHPFGDSAAIASGVIVDVHNYEFLHNISTEHGSSGCPIILLNNNSNLIQVIGIHKCASYEKRLNGGTFIGEIIDQVNNNQILKRMNQKEKINDEDNKYYNSNNSKNIGKNNFSYSNNKNININSINNNNYNDYINDIRNNNNNNKISNYNKNNSKINNKNINDNYIIAEVIINKYNINKKIRIINSYEKHNKDISNKKLIPDLMNEKEIKDTEIFINNELIPFDYFHEFNKMGQNIIKYKFKNNLIKTDYMFYECYELTNIDLTNFNAENIVDMKNMFRECSYLKSINLANLKTKNVSNMDNIFRGCSSLISINLSNLDNKNLESMTHMFDGCSSLKNLNLTKFTTKNVINMEGLFWGCSSLENINLSSFDTRLVKNMDSMFRGCESLKVLDLSNFETNADINTNFMFYRCRALTKINLLNFKCSHHYTIQSMFEGCDLLSKNNVIINDNKTREKIRSLIPLNNNCEII